MRLQRLKSQNGYSLFELIMVMIVISVLTATSLRYMESSVDNSRVEETKVELNQFADGIIGDEQLISGNHRIDYGYVGDVGSLPISLSDLVTNPGLATWDGPYLHDDFYASSGASESEYLIDGWGKTYSYASSLNISSTGGSTTITKALANSTDAILNNTLSFNIVDIDYCPPGTTNIDSVIFNLTYPNGSGGYQTDSKFPSAGGFVEFISIPIGQQTLEVIELKNNDTLTRKVHVNLNSSIHANIQIPNSLWCDTSSSGGGGGSGFETLRPNASGAVTDLSDEGCSSNFSCVDEVTSDGNSTYVKGGGNSYEYDLYNITNSAISSGTIDSVIVYINASKTTNGNSQRLGTYILTNGNYDYSEKSTTQSYADYSTTYINNPQSSSAWSWAEIDALQIGAGIRREARVTQVWVEVYYTN